MSDERIIRLENAMATLAEVSARHDERPAVMERSVKALARPVQTLVELTANQAELSANQQRRQNQAGRRNNG
ncbi:MAG: hypothetical protein M3348_10695 [Acidobacteriota bacterium]|nr:hypothetical protein [Acidobacteriota bacterium]